MKYTTLNIIRDYKLRESGWQTLLNHLNKTIADDEDLSFATILESNGIEDAIWCLRTLPLKEQLPFRADIAESVVHIYEEQYPDDLRVRDCIAVTRDFAAGKATEEQLQAAAGAAYAADAANSAAPAAANAAYAAAGYRRAKWIEIEQLFIKHFCEE